MTQKFADAARAELASTLTAASTTITVVAGGALFPVANTGTSAVGTATDWFKLVVQDNDAIEIVYVRTHAAGSNTFSDVLRGQDGTAPRQFDPPAVVGLRPVASDMTTVTGALANLKPVATTGKLEDLTGNLTAGTATFTGGLAVFDGAPGSYRNFRFLSNGTIRWDFGVDNVPESGGNAGSNFYLNAFADDGSYIGSYMSGSRQYGIYMPQVSTVTKAVGDNSTAVATTEYVDRIVGKTKALALNFAFLDLLNEGDYVGKTNDAFGPVPGVSLDYAVMVRKRAEGMYYQFVIFQYDGRTRAGVRYATSQSWGQWEVFARERDVGNPEMLTTTTKSSLVAAINEVNAKPAPSLGTVVPALVVAGKMMTATSATVQQYVIGTASLREITVNTAGVAVTFKRPTAGAVPSGARVVERLRLKAVGGTRSVSVDVIGTPIVWMSYPDRGLWVDPDKYLEIEIEYQEDTGNVYGQIIGTYDEQKVKIISAASYALTEADEGYTLVTYASNTVIEIPNSDDYGDGFTFSVRNRSSTRVLVSATSGSIIYPNTAAALYPKESATFTSDGGNETWSVVGRDNVVKLSETSAVASVASVAVTVGFDDPEFSRIEVNVEQMYGATASAAPSITLRNTSGDITTASYNYARSALTGQAGRSDAGGTGVTTVQVAPPLPQTSGTQWASFKVEVPLNLAGLAVFSVQGVSNIGSAAAPYTFTTAASSNISLSSVRGITLKMSSGNVANISRTVTYGYRK